MSNNEQSKIFNDIQEHRTNLKFEEYTVKVIDSKTSTFDIVINKYPHILLSIKDFKIRSDDGNLGELAPEYELTIKTSDGTTPKITFIDSLLEPILTDMVYNAIQHSLNK